MPIYEFYCPGCHTIYNFFSGTINTTKQPSCPRCENQTLTRLVSLFAIGGRHDESDDGDDLPIDEGKLASAMEALSREADGLDEDDPRQAAQLMEKLTDMTGMELGPGMSEALERIKKGDDPEQIEQELGDLLEDEEPFVLPGKRRASSRLRRAAPRRDDRLYDL